MKKKKIFGCGENRNFEADLAVKENFKPVGQKMGLDTTVPYEFASPSQPGQFPCSYICQGWFSIPQQDHGM